MRDYILDIARALHHDRPNIDIDEIAAIGGVETAHVLQYFRSYAALRRAAGCSVGDPLGGWPPC